MINLLIYKCHCKVGHKVKLVIELRYDDGRLQVIQNCRSKSLLTT